MRRIFRLLLPLILAAGMVILPAIPSDAWENFESESYVKEVDAELAFPEASTYHGFASQAEILVTDREFVQAVVAPQSPGYYPGVPTGIGCMGYTERVHKSGGMASAHSGVKGCGQSVEFMAAGAEIMKKGWGYGTGGHSMLRRVRI